MYGLTMDTGSGDVIDATSNGSYNMLYYLQFANPYETATAPNTAIGTLTYDAIVADVTIQTTAGSAGSTKDQAVFNWTTSPSDLSTK